MSALFRRQSTASCFFCQSSVVPLPQNLRSFRCPHCQCWNRFDGRGEIMSDEPAMHDESLNRRSFAKRASPSKDRLLNMYGKGLFCHTCQTNQMLLVNLLSNYLPSPDHTEYERRLESLPEYEESLHMRYPPVCTSCRPLVEEEIQSKDRMARTWALGEWLKQSKGKGIQRQDSASGTGTRRIRIEMDMWRARGCLWVITMASCLIGNLVGAMGARFPRRYVILPLSSLPVLVFTSILWTAWDPTYASLRKAQLQGRDVRQKGKGQYIVLQLAAWSSRLLTTILISISHFRPHLDILHLSYNPPSRRSRLYFSVLLAVELIILIISCTVLQLQRPSPIRLIDTSSHKLTSTRQTPDPTFPVSRPPPINSIPEQDLIATLSLSSKPIVSPTNPIFGVPSLMPPQSSHELNYNNNTIPSDPDPDAMDWTPTNNPFPPNRGKQDRFLGANEDGSLIRRQTFFAPEQPTGLEGLFERTRLADDKNNSISLPQDSDRTRWWKRLWLGAFLVVPITAVGYKFWKSPDSLSSFTGQQY